MMRKERMIAWALISTYSPAQWFTNLCLVLIFLLPGILFYPPIKRMGEERRKETWSVGEIKH